jgi:hypothetical protein
MTTTLYEMPQTMSVIREGLVVRRSDGTAKGDGQSDWVLARICRRAGLPVRYRHVAETQLRNACHAVLA